MVSYILGSTVFRPQSEPNQVGEVVGAEASFNANGGEPFLLRIFNPSGRSVAAISGNLDSGSGRHTLHIQTVANDPGKYEVAWDFDGRTVHSAVITIEGLVTPPPPPPPPPPELVNYTLHANDLELRPLAKAIVTVGNSVSAAQTKATGTDGNATFQVLPNMDLLVSVVAPRGFNVNPQQPFGNFPRVTNQLSFNTITFPDRTDRIFFISLTPPIPPPEPDPEPEPEPEPISNHEIEIFFRNPFGVGQRLAETAAKQEGAIQKLLPEQFTYTGYTLKSNSVILHIREEGRNFIFSATIIAIVAIFIVLLALLFIGFQYKENRILKQTLVAKQETKTTIEACLDNPDIVVAIVDLV